MIILTISLYLIWILYNLIEGHREAHFYHIASKEDKITELHHIFLAQRFLVFLILNSALIFYLDYKLILFDIAIICIQPFIHNGMYYYTRWKLDNKIYTKKWFDQSNSSTAFSTKFETLKFRILYLIISIVSIVSIFFI